MPKPLCTALLLALATSPGQARDAAPPARGQGQAQAQAMVKKAVAHVQAQGPDKAYADFSDKAGPFIDRSFYVTVYRMDGRCLAHGANPRQIGRDLIELADIEGRAFVKERLTLAQSQPGGFWHHYKFLNPATQKIEAKAMYCERLADTVVCSGAYD